MVEYSLGFGRRKLIEQIIIQNWNIENPEKKVFTFNELLFVIQEMITEEGKAYFEGKSINRGFQIFRDFAKYILYRALANYDSMLLMTGLKGSGKSSAAIMLAREYCKIIGIKFDPVRHIAYNNADVMRKINELNKFEPLICDEAVRFASAAEWAKRENKQLKKRLAEVRTKHLFFILCYPLKITRLEKNYLDSFVNYWVDIFARGSGAIFVRDMNPVHDSWRLQDFKDIGSYTEFNVDTFIEKVLKKHPNFWNTIKFPKPPKWLYEKYLAVREKNVYDDENVLVNVTREDVYNALLILTLRDIMLHDVSLSLNRVLLHIKNTYDLNIKKGFIELAIEDAKQLVSKIREEGMNFFDKEDNNNTNVQSNDTEQNR